ncbi:MAG TPA: ABC transporter permease [Thermoanaerobaculia bacterium]|nr:ABC transporter permease [Thermoanaerobaculia bacterium]
MTVWMDDLRHAVRKLAQSPGFTLAAVLTLGLGIGANTTVFSIVDAVVLRPLPYEHPRELVAVAEVRRGRAAPISVSAPNFLDWSRDNHVFRALAGYSETDVTLAGASGPGGAAAGEPQRLSAMRASASLFPLLGVRPALGRTYSDAEDREGVGRVVVLSDGLWRRRFAADPGVVGRAIRLDGGPATVIGVMPAGFAFPDRDAELWLPMAFSKDELGGRSGHFLFVVGRLLPGVSLPQAKAEMAAISARLARQYPDDNAIDSALLSPLDEQVAGAVKPLLLVLLGAVGFVLLIACANVANLLLARAAARQREFAIRAALGAGRGRLLREMLTESLPLCLLGGTAGVLVALWGTDLVVRLVPAGLPRAEGIGMDGRVLAFTLAVSLLTGLTFTLIPGLQAARATLNETLKEGGRGGTDSPGRRRARGVLVIAELALSLVLLIGAGLMIRSFAQLSEVDPGFRPAGLLTARVNLPDAKYGDDRKSIAFFDDLLSRLAALPGAKSAAAVAPLPLSGNQISLAVLPVGRPARPGEKRSANWRTVSAGYFRTMGIPLLRGRAFDRRDGPSARAMIVNQTMARREWPGEDPLGKRVTIGWNDITCEVVGVVGDVRHQRLDVDAGAEMYTAYPETPYSRMDLVVRAAGDPRRLAGALRAAVRQVDPDQAVYSLRPMTELMSQSKARARFGLVLLGAFAGLALALAAVGIYGVMAYTVVQRTHEIGIRMALGAGRVRVLRLVVRDGAALALAGLALGTAGALAVTRFLSSLLFAVSTRDPLTFAAVPAILGGVALLASYLPARRATRVDPLVALRHE